MPGQRKMITAATTMATMVTAVSGRKLNASFPSRTTA